MFYLLENNRIIETSSTEWYCGRLKVILNEEERYKYSNHISWNLKDGYYKYFTVKKQSNNVLDLIEVGDLIRCSSDIHEIKHVYHGDDSFVTDFVTSGCGICFPSWGKFLKEFNAIYKPDDKGNYIKVWEKEEEDNYE